MLGSLVGAKENARPKPVERNREFAQVLKSALRDPISYFWTRALLGCCVNARGAGPKRKALGDDATSSRYKSVNGRAKISRLRPKTTPDVQSSVHGHTVLP